MTDPVSSPCPDAIAANVVPSVTLQESFRVWTRVAMLSFGGPAAQIAVMHRIIVDEKEWLDERRFLHALNFCMLLPGPEAQQLATYTGWLMHGIRGGLMAGGLFILPGFVSILVLSLLYVSLEGSAAFQTLFFGLKCAVLAVVAEAIIRISKRVLKSRALVCVSVVSFLLLYLKVVSFPVLILLSGTAGIFGHRVVPQWFTIPRKPIETTATESVKVVEYTVATPVTGSLWKRSLIVSAICLSLWFGPVIAVHAFTGPDSVYTKSALFFSKAAMVTFGGAYSVLSYVDQQAVDHYHWIEKGEMLDGLGLAETTPGPLIMVVQFVGFLAAARHDPHLHPLLAGTLGAVLTTWVTFVPCFYWIFLGAPYMESLLGKPLLNAALTTVTAAVVGVIANLGVSMATATLFRRSAEYSMGWISLPYPIFATLRPDAVIIAALAAVLLLVLHRGLAVTLTTCVIAGAILRSLT
jgi:chromate transporter